MLHLIVVGAIIINGNIQFPFSDNTEIFWTANPLTGIHYQINPSSFLTWHKARSSCLQQNAELVSITEIHDQAFLKGKVTKELWEKTLWDTLVPLKSVIRFPQISMGWGFLIFFCLSQLCLSNFLIKLVSSSLNVAFEKERAKCSFVAQALETITAYKTGGSDHSLFRKHSDTGPLSIPGKILHSMSSHLSSWWQSSHNLFIF